MNLTKPQKKTIENKLVATINQNSENGIDTRVLIDTIMATITPSIPNVNRHNIAGMLSSVWKNYDYSFVVRTRSHSVIK